VKHLKAKNKISNYNTVTMEMKDLVPASIYENIPDKEKLLPDITKGNLEYPLLVYQAEQDYWTKNHLPLYKSGSPALPDLAPEIATDIVVKGNLQNDKRIHVIWSGRQRFQLAKELGYTHIDCIIEPIFHKMVGEAGRFKKLNQ